MNPFPLSSSAAPVFEEIRQALPRLTLVAKPPSNSTLPQKLEDLSDEELLGGKILAPDMASLVRAGLLLRLDQLKTSHAISQKIPSPEGSYWHGILHRREPDYSNAKYWFARVGEHPLYRDLMKMEPGSVPGSLAAGRAGWEEITRGSRWDAARFVDLCEACENGAKPSLREELESLQEIEMELLLQFCALRALGRKTSARRGKP